MMGVSIQRAGFNAAEALNFTIAFVGLGLVWLLYASSRTLASR